jgi:Uma2 family endonuclease
MGSRANRKLDYMDYLATPSDGRRHEILDGALHVTPAPTPRHQWVSWGLERQLADYFHKRGLGKMFHAPIDVILTDGDIVQPDIVVCERTQVSARGIEGIPLIVLEILSPSTRKHDLELKAQRYAKLGVPHYWIVDPEAKRVDCHRLEENRYPRIAGAEGQSSFVHPDWRGLVIDLVELWDDLPG